jgi:four helix bundle protein
VRSERQETRSKKQEARNKKQETRSKKTRREGKSMIQSYKDLKVYQLSYKLAMQVFWLTKKFPKEELYALTSQIRESSRSIPGNLAEGWSKRHYENIFKRHIIDSTGSCDETKVWLDFSLDCGYIQKSEHEDLIQHYQEVGKMLHGLFENWQTYET